MNWKRLLGDRLTVVNGDKPVIRRMGDTFYVYGTPWAGKEGLQSNIKTPLRKICFIERSEENFCKRVDDDLFRLIIPHVYRPADVDALFRSIDLIGGAIKKAELYVIGCNKELSSAETAYSEIMKA